MVPLGQQDLIIHLSMATTPSPPALLTACIVVRCHSDGDLLAGSKAAANEWRTTSTGSRNVLLRSTTLPATAFEATSDALPSIAGDNAHMYCDSPDDMPTPTLTHSPSSTESSSGIVRSTWPASSTTWAPTSVLTQCRNTLPCPCIAPHHLTHQQILHSSSAQKHTASWRMSLQWHPNSDGDHPLQYFEPSCTLSFAFFVRHLSFFYLRMWTLHHSRFTRSYLPTVISLFVFGVFLIFTKYSHSFLFIWR
jgi:hypothetical protein